MSYNPLTVSLGERRKKKKKGYLFGFAFIGGGCLMLFVVDSLKAGTDGKSHTIYDKRDGLKAEKPVGKRTLQTSTVPNSFSVSPSPFFFCLARANSEIFKVFPADWRATTWGSDVLSKQSLMGVEWPCEPMSSRRL